jgi:hypothetical protein
MRAAVTALILAGIILVTSGEAAWCASLDGNTLYKDCSSKPGKSGDDFQVGVCTGYVVGIAEVMFSGNQVNGFRACAPEGITRRQVTDIVVKWLNENPTERHRAAVGLVAAALTKAFPCAK